MRIKSYAAQTHQGPYFQVNEDAYDFDFETEIFMVLDGFGGSGIGDRAVEKLKGEIKTFYSQISDDPNATMPLYYNPRNLLEGNALLNSIFHAHQNLYQSNQSRPLTQRAGASAVVAARAESIMILMGVGNCCAYHYRQGSLTKVIFEDTFNFLAKSSYENQKQSYPMNAFGMYSELNHQMREVRLLEGDKVLLMTDGLYAHLSEEEILHHLNKNATDSHERLNNLLKLSNTHGNSDNQTGLILEF